jgi:hypothetical protein
LTKKRIICRTGVSPVPNPILYKRRTGVSPVPNPILYKRRTGILPVHYRGHRRPACATSGYPKRRRTGILPVHYRGHRRDACATSGYPKRRRTGVPSDPLQGGTGGTPVLRLDIQKGVGPAFPAIHYRGHRRDACATSGYSKRRRTGVPSDPFPASPPKRRRTGVSPVPYRGPKGQRRIHAGESRTQRSQTQPLRENRNTRT